MICLQLLQWGHYRYDSGSPLKRKCHHFHEISLLPPKMESYPAAKMITFTCDYGMLNTATGTIATALSHHDMFATAIGGPILTRLRHIMTYVYTATITADTEAVLPDYDMFTTCTTGPIPTRFWHIVTCLLMLLWCRQ